MQAQEAELLLQAKNGDDLAFEQLLKQYKNLVNSICRRYFLVGGDVDDLLQEGMIGLYKAVKSYDQGKNASFSTYATTVVQRQLINAIKKANSPNQSVLNDYVALNNQGGISKNGSWEEEGDGVYFIANANPNSPEKLILHTDDVKQLLKQINQTLSPYENTILELYLQGLTYHQIAQELKKSPKSIDNALNRMKNKLKFLNKSK